MQTGRGNYLKKLRLLGLVHFSRKDFGPCARADLTQQRSSPFILWCFLRLKTDFLVGEEGHLYHCVWCALFPFFCPQVQVGAAPAPKVLSISPCCAAHLVALPHVPVERLKCDFPRLGCTSSVKIHTNFEHLVMEKMSNISSIIFMLITFWNDNILDIIVNRIHFTCWFSLSNVVTRRFKITYMVCITVFCWTRLV